MLEMCIGGVRTRNELRGVVDLAGRRISKEIEGRKGMNELEGR